MDLTRLQSLKPPQWKQDVSLRNQLVWTEPGLGEDVLSCWWVYLPFVFSHMVTHKVSTLPRPLLVLWPMKWGICSIVVGSFSFINQHADRWIEWYIWRVRYIAHSRSPISLSNSGSPTIVPRMGPDRKPGRSLSSNRRTKPGHLCGVQGGRDQGGGVFIIKKQCTVKISQVRKVRKVRKGITGAEMSMDNAWMQEVMCARFPGRELKNKIKTLFQIWKERKSNTFLCNVLMQEFLNSALSGWKLYANSVVCTVNSTHSAAKSKLQRYRRSGVLPCAWVHSWCK